MTARDYDARRIEAIRESRDRTFEERFWARVEKTETCWLWRGLLATTGYGSCSRRARLQGAHRLSYEMAFGPIPPGLSVLHRCDVRACVNPAHLFLGTHADNMADMVAKDRHTHGGWRLRYDQSARGNRNARATFDVVTVLVIKMLLRRGHRCGPIARALGRPKPGVYSIAIGRTWGHVAVDGATPEARTLARLELLRLESVMRARGAA